MAADFTVKATLDDQISPGLAKIQQQTNKTVAAFDKFKTAIAGLAIGALIQKSIAYADAIKDINEATNIAIENVLGFQKAVDAAGGSIEGAQTALLKFTSTAGDAANGSLGLQNAFREVGVSLNDLRTLNEQDLFEKTLAGLSGIEDISKRTRLQTELLGKSVKGVNFKGLSDDYKTASAASAKYSQDIKAAAEVQDRLDRAFGQLKLSVLKAIGPLADFASKLKPEQIDRFVNAVVQIGGAAVGLAAVGKVVTSVAAGFTYLAGAAGVAWGVFKSGILGVSGGMAALSAISLTVSNLFRNLFQLWSIGFTSVAGLVARFGTSFVAIRGALALMAVPLGVLAVGFAKIAAIIAAVVAVIWAVDKAIKAAFDVSPIDWFTDKIGRAYTAFKEFITGTSSGAGAGRGGNESITKQLQAQGEEMRRQAEQAKEKAKVEREVQDALEKQRQAIVAIGDNFKEQLSAKEAQLKLETDLIGKSEQYKDTQTQLADLTAKVTEEVNKLRDAQAALTEDQKKGGLSAEYDKQIARIQELAKAEKERLTNLVDLLHKAKAAEELRRFGIQQEYDLQDKLKALDRERADLTLTDIEKKYLDIGRAADDAAKAAIRAEEARRGTPLSTQEAQKYYDASRAGTLKLIDAQKKLYDQSRTFSTGWNKAFKEYVDNARNAAQAAQRVFEKFTSGIEDLLVNFAKTGKFEWKNFVNDMLEELLRSQIKQTLASIMTMQNPFSGSGGSIGDLFGGIFGSLLGSSGAQRGQSATSPMYVLDVSGKMGGSVGALAKAGSASTGGGFFDSIGNAVSSIGSTIGSIFGGTAGKYGTNVGSQQSRMLYDQEAGMGGGFFDGISNAVSSAGSWINDNLFGGFFANGGNLPAGKFGIVGERGPELIGGPASITPMGGGSVTYNINAVDAASFKALVAADPGFIHAVAMKGAGNVPARR